MRTAVVVLSLAVALGAPASAQEAQKERPTQAPKMGTYDLELTTESGTLVGELTLGKKGDEVEAKLVAAGNRPNVKSFVRGGDKYVLSAGHGTFTFVYHLSFQRDSVFGDFMSSGVQAIEGKVAGALRK